MPRTHARWMLAGAAVAGLLVAGCRVEVGAPGAGPAGEGTGPAEGEVWVYTSMYQSVVNELSEAMKTELPGVDVRFNRAGSEKIAQKVEAEWAAGGSRACLLMTSDPFWYADLQAEGRLQPHLSPNVLKIDRSLVNLDGMWTTARISLMVLAAHEEVTEPPRRFEDLTAPAWKRRFSTGDPLASGTHFTTMAFLHDAHGWTIYEQLRANGLIGAGGNSSVLSRVERREREVGVVLLENLLAAKTKNTPARPVFPEDGAIVVPGPVALTRDCPNPRAARAVYDFMLSEQGQKIMVRGNMYAVLPGIEPPEGAPALDTIATRPWKAGWLEETAEERETLKRAYEDLMAGPK